jgi:mannose-6-phosphate isomerase-like protein (cupin superfamily)
MEHVTVDEVDDRMGPADVKRPLGRALGAEDVAVNYYELAPGDSFAFGFHAHEDQEEVFYVLEGEATFDIGEEREEVPVGAGEVIRIPPGQFQFGYNDSEGRVEGVAIAAPGARHNWEDIESLAPCPECETETSHGVKPLEDGELLAYCEECGHEMRSG